MSANPGGYLDPFRLSDFSDPLVRQTYHAYHMDVVRETVARTVPTINYPGATAFHNALDENLMAALTKAKTSEQAMADTETRVEEDRPPYRRGQTARSHQDQQGGLADRSRSDRLIRLPGSAPEGRGGRVFPSALNATSKSSQMKRSVPFEIFRYAAIFAAHGGDAGPDPVDGVDGLQADRRMVGDGRRPDLVAEAPDAQQFPVHLRSSPPTT